MAIRLSRIGHTAVRVRDIEAASTVPDDWDPDTTADRYHRGTVRQMGG